jgi:hypothetical protein
MIMLSFGLAQQGWQDAESWLRDRVLALHGMTAPYIQDQLPHVVLARRHRANRRPPVARDFPIGVGGVRTALKMPAS